MDKERKRELKRRYADEQRREQRAWMVLGEDELNDLLDYVDARVAADGCDHTLRFTRRWAAERERDGDELAHSLGRFGGFCDCEVVLNVAPEEIFR